MNPDVLILHLGYFKEMVPPNPNDFLGDEEESFEENLQIIKKLKAKNTVFTHIEEMWKKII